MTTAFTILAFLTSLCFFQAVIWKRRAKRAMAERDRANDENHELEIQLRGARAGQIAKRVYCDEWADIIE